MEKSYSTLFNGVTQTIDTIEIALRELKMYQQIAEENYLEEMEEQEKNYIIPNPASAKRLKNSL